MIVLIIQDVQINEGQIIWAILYRTFKLHWKGFDVTFLDSIVYNSKDLSFSLSLSLNIYKFAVMDNNIDLICYSVFSGHSVPYMVTETVRTKSGYL